MLKFQEIFKIFFKKLLKKEELSQNEVDSLRKAVESTEIETLYLWTKPLIQEIYLETKKQEKEAQSSSYFGMWKGKTEDLTEEDLEKVEKILENSITNINKEIMQSKSGVFLRTEFQLDRGTFTFSSEIARDKAGFAFEYEDLNLSFKKGTHFFELSSQLKAFHVNLVNTINYRRSRIPLTFKEKGVEPDMDYTFKLRLRKSSLMEEVGTIFHFHLVTA